MSEKTYQAKLTEEEINSSLKTLAAKIACYGITEDGFDRFNYLAKRILKIQKGDPEINNETDQSENPAPVTPEPVGWS